MEYGLSGAAQQQIGQAHSNYATAQIAPEAPAIGLLAQAKESVTSCQKMLNDLHTFADQYIGIRVDEKGVNSPSPVPNGAVEELRDSILHLQHRLGALCHRLSVL